MRIGIIGTRGIPNQYGGFEEFAEHFSQTMAERGHEVYVYTSHRHPYTLDTYNDVNLVRCYDPEYLIGTAGQFLYDLNCIRHSRKMSFDIILQLGYTTSTIWSWLFPKEAIIATNMDGLEWSRAKYNKITQYFLTFAERWGVLHSDYLIADSKGIQDYLQDKYGVRAALIPYGADVYDERKRDADYLDRFATSADEHYDLLIARFEPENNIETILQAYSGLTDQKLILVGNHQNTTFGKKMYHEYHEHSHIQFAGPVFDKPALNVLRHHSRIYLHGHSVGGTNPSLLEAMACDTLICAHNNMFNRYVLGDEALYFSNAMELAELARMPLQKQKHGYWLWRNRQKILHDYNWNLITNKIEHFFTEWKYGRQQEDQALSS